MGDKVGRVLWVSGMCSGYLGQMRRGRRLGGCVNVNWHARIVWLCRGRDTGSVKWEPQGRLVGLRGGWNWSMDDLAARGDVEASNLEGP